MSNVKKNKILICFCYQFFNDIITFNCSKQHFLGKNRTFLCNHLATMAPKVHMTPKKCPIIVQYHEGTRSVRDVAGTVTLSRSTVQKCVMPFKTTGTGESRPRSGRPRVSDKRHNNCMRHSVLIKPSLTSSEIKENVSTRTIHRTLVTEFGLHYKLS